MQLKPIIKPSPAASRTSVAFAISAITIILVAVAITLVVPASAAESGKVVATVGNHKITEQELDEHIKQQVAELQSQMYEIKKQAIDSMADDYLVEQAAQKEKLTPDKYLKRHLGDKKISEADAKAYYDSHKELSARFPNFAQIKDRLSDALQNQYDEQRKQELISGLRKDHPVKVMLVAPRVEVHTAGHPEMGPKNAPITIVEFSDFQCPFCKRAEPVLKQVREKYGDQVKLVYMDFPLDIHPNAMPAAAAARCAAEQGKFWQYHDQLFDDQSKLDPADLKADAKKLGLDAAKFDTCFKQDKYKNGIAADLEEGKDLGVNGTPAFYVNGRPLTGAQPYQHFAEVIDEELASSNPKQARAN